MNEEQMEHRFGSLREKSLEELKQLEIELNRELDSWTEVFSSKTSISEEKTDAWNEIKFLDDQLFYITKLISELEHGKKR